ncbi:MAG: NADPH-dependent glutamate synthase [Clostridiales bacterium]|nr:NADPH-dependent glutamate synthase [Clostridiales bacterium]
MEVLNMERVPVRELDAKERVKNFEEVCLGYNEEEAVLEASRCINCKNSKCVQNCPVGVNIPKFIEYIKNKDFKQAAEVVFDYNSLPSICGRVCPQESQCEGGCILGIKGQPVAIGKLERFVGDYVLENNIEVYEKKEQNGKKVAVVGSGPAGLSCASTLARLGYSVTIFEALHEAGGVLVYGIPEFRLPKDKVVKKEIENLIKLGVEIKTNVIVGRTITIEELLEDYQAVFVGTGAGLPRFMGIKGENANGVYSANEFLTRANLMKAFLNEYETPIKIGKKVAVIGGGNVAMDAARTAVRLGAEVHIVYRRTEDEMPSRLEELHHAKEEGIIFDTLTNPVEILQDENGWVKGMVLRKMELGEADESGRRSPIEVEGSDYVENFDTVVMAIGTIPNPLISYTTSEIQINKRKCIVVEEDTGKTTMDGVYAGGDAVTGAATVILAMGAGKKAAYAIDEYIKANS